MNQYKFENNLPQSGFNVKTFTIALLFFLLISYGVFNARNLIIGPTIEIFSPVKNTETGENTIIIKGLAKNITFISLNEKPIFVDKEGLFEEKLLLSPGSNTIEIEARDRFKQKAQKIIKIYYKEGTSTLIN